MPVRFHFPMPGLVSLFLPATKLARIFAALLFKLPVLSCVYFRVRQIAFNPLQNPWLIVKGQARRDTRHFCPPSLQGSSHGGIYLVSKDKALRAVSSLTTCLFLQLLF